MKMHLKHNQGRGMCHWDKYVIVVEEWALPCRADATMSATCLNWFWHFKAATALHTFMKRNQCGGMLFVEREEEKIKLIEDWKMLMSRNIWWGGHRWPERMSAMSRPHGGFLFPTSLTDLRSSLRPCSGSFYNMTLRDDRRRGGQEWSGWYDGQTWWNESPS